MQENFGKLRNREGDENQGGDQWAVQDVDDVSPTRGADGGARVVSVAGVSPLQ
jgi:hypothetical protein